jgi:hypothetical protein
VGLLVDNLIVRATRVFEVGVRPPSTVVTRPQNPYYITEQTRITLGPSEQCNPPHRVHPLSPYFVARQTVSSTKQVGGGFEASINPKFTITGRKSYSDAIERVPVAVTVCTTF